MGHNNEFMRAASHRPALRILAPLAACVLLLTACTSPVGNPSIEVTTEDRVFAPVKIRMTGMEPGAEVTLRSEASIGDFGFAASAVFVAGTDGVVDLSEAEPVSGDWAVADPMAPFWASTGGIANQPSLWDEPYDVRLTILDGAGDALAETTVHRPGLAPGVHSKSVTDDGIVGVYAVPADLNAGEQRPAVLVFGGSEGGGEFAAATARWIAGLGYPALGISYFGSEGQPPRLEEVPAETFLAALAWLHEQDEVDDARVFTHGTSRGGEMALWLAATHPTEVFGAFAPVGAGAVVCGAPNAALPAWTLAGKPLVDDCFGPPETMVPPDAVIDVAAIGGPVVLACGTADQLWPSCEFAADIVDRRGRDQETGLARGKGADHYVSLPPYTPWPGLTEDPATLAATHVVRVEFWRIVRDTLADASSPGG